MCDGDPKNLFFYVIVLRQMLSIKVCPRFIGRYDTWNFWYCRSRCPIQCLRFHIKDREGNIYIGKACKIVNACSMHFGKDVSIMPYTMLVCHNGGSIKIGEGSEIGMFSRIASRGEVIIGKNVFSGPHIFIADYNHEYRYLIKNMQIQKKGIQWSCC